jgi:hypothetical protein
MDRVEKIIAPISTIAGSRMEEKVRRDGTAADFD